MKSIRTDIDRDISRLGTIGKQEWWHCRACGDVWTTTHRADSGGRSLLAIESRRHAATHAQPQLALDDAWAQTPSLVPMSEKHR
jgi:hypothetical protein